MMAPRFLVGLSLVSARCVVLATFGAWPERRRETIVAVRLRPGTRHVLGGDKTRSAPWQATP